MCLRGEIATVSSSGMTTAGPAPGTFSPVESLFERLRRVDPRLWDALLAALMVGLGVLGFAFREALPNEPPAVYGYTLIVVAGGSLAWRRRAPLIVLVVVGAAVSASALAGYWTETFFLLWVALYTAAAYRDRGRLVPVLIPVVLCAAAATVIGENSRTHGGVGWAGYVADLVFTVVVPVLLGRMTYNRRRRLARDREVAAREAVAAERARIARELHDVVAHHMSVMVVQAEAARAVGSRDPVAAAEALRNIEAAGRTGMAEMRRVLEVLESRPDGDGREPQPGLGQLADLLERMRATGMHVDADVAGTPRPLPPGVDLSAYRIVQEALTNTLKHAGGASAHVSVRYEPDAVEVEVVDDGLGPPTGFGSKGTSGGHGLVGMRERAQLFGGQLDAGARSGGGFRVLARLPAETVA
jgi:signal transduction histidine kinase